MQERLCKTLKRYLILLLLGGIYFTFWCFTGVGLPCLFYRITGLQCPACGGSHMLLSLLKFDFFAAYRYNPFLLINAPVLLSCFLYSDLRYIKTGDPSLGKLGFLLWGEVALALLFGVFRNLV